MFFIKLTEFLQNSHKREKHEAEEIMYKFLNENVSEEATVLTGSRGGEHPDMHIWQDLNGKWSTWLISKILWIYKNRMCT